MEEDKGITITYETLFEILRREKDRLELQKLDNSFFSDVASYIKEKQGLIGEREAQQELFTEDEKVKTQKQLENIKKILRELYERREKKIINMALDKSKTKSNLIDTSALLSNEKNLFEALVGILDKNRENILLKLLDGELPGTIKQKEEIKAEEAKPKEEFKEANALLKEKSTKLIRFKHAVPKFLGLESEEFGPFEEEDIASLPQEIADVLINKGRAEEIKED